MKKRNLLIIIGASVILISTVGSIITIYSFVSQEFHKKVPWFLSVPITLFVISAIAWLFIALKNQIESEKWPSNEIIESIDKFLKDYQSKGAIDFFNESISNTKNDLGNTIKDFFYKESSKLEEKSQRLDQNFELLKGLDIVDVETVANREKDANEVWVFTPDLRIDLHHEAFKGAIKENLKQLENFKKVIEKYKNILFEKESSDFIKVEEKLKELMEKKADSPYKSYRYIVPNTIDPAFIDDFKRRFKEIFKEFRFGHHEIDKNDIEIFFDRLFYFIPSEQIVNGIIQETVIYDPDSEDRDVFRFPNIEKPRFAFVETSRKEIPKMILDFKAKYTAYENIHILELDAEELYIITNDLSLDVNIDFYEKVNKNLKYESQEKIKTGGEKFFDCKYKYIILETKERRNILNDNLKTYKEKILPANIDENEIFLKIKPNLGNDFLTVFGAIFQERTIYKKNGKCIYYQITDPDDPNVKYKPLQNDKLVEKFIKSFKKIWENSFDYYHREFLSEDRYYEGKQKLIKLLSKVIKQISCNPKHLSDKSKVKDIFEKFGISEKLELNDFYDDEILKKLLGDFDLQELIKNYHW